MTARARRIAATLPALCAILLLAGCGGAETKLRNGLVSAGISEPMAACMARPMAQQLSVGQLMKLRSLSRVPGLDPRRTSYDKLLHHIRALGDPEILRIASAAALGCAFGA